MAQTMRLALGGSGQYGLLSGNTDGGGMIIRQHQKDDAASVAIYSPDERYRYGLTRNWAGGPRALFVMLNPSTATEVQNDPTVERCERRARALGFGSFAVANIFAFRATDPKVMRAEADPVGPDNDRILLDLAATAQVIICAWGTHGAYLQRGPQVGALLRGVAPTLYHLGLSQAGHPKHPLYISYETRPEPWV
jgi:hypothetical protein